MCFENVPYKTLYNGKNRIWNSSQMTWDSLQTSAIIAENLHFPYFWNPSCVRKNMPTYACFGPHMWAKGHFGLLFPKIGFCSFKRLYFSFYHSLNQFDIRLCFKWALGLRVWASLENEGPSRKRYKMWCLQMPLF